MAYLSEFFLVPQCSQEAAAERCKEHPPCPSNHSLSTGHWLAGRLAGWLPGEERALKTLARPVARRSVGRSVGGARTTARRGRTCHAQHCAVGKRPRVHERTTRVARAGAARAALGPLQRSERAVSFTSHGWRSRTWIVRSALLRLHARGVVAAAARRRQAKHLSEE